MQVCEYQTDKKFAPVLDEGTNNFPNLGERVRIFRGNRNVGVEGSLIWKGGQFSNATVKTDSGDLIRTQMKFLKVVPTEHRPPVTQTVIRTKPAHQTFKYTFSNFRVEKMAKHIKENLANQISVRFAVDQLVQTCGMNDEDALKYIRSKG